MGFDIQMRQPPTAAEVKKAGLDASDPGYYRYNIRAMAVMVMTMEYAGVVVDDESEPAFPDLGSLPEARLDAMTAALWKPALDSKLPPQDRITVARYRAVLQTKSKHAGKVPAYKFEVNDGFLVAADECTAIAKALRSYRPDPAKLADLKKVWHDREAAVNAAVGDKVGTPVYGDEELSLSLADWKQWIADWAAYNEVAARHGGYLVQ